MTPKRDHNASTLQRVMPAGIQILAAPVPAANWCTTVALTVNANTGENTGRRACHWNTRDKSKWDATMRQSHPMNNVQSVQERPLSIQWSFLVTTRFATAVSRGIRPFQNQHVVQSVHRRKCRLR
jgi:hypothetical protein